MNMRNPSLLFHPPSPLFSQMPKRARSTESLVRPTRSQRTTRNISSKLHLPTFQQDLQNRLVTASDPQYKAWLHQYLKGATPTLGLKMGAIEQTVSEWVREQNLVKKDPAAMKQLALDLFQLPHEEEKQAAIMFLNTLQKRKLITIADISAIEGLFDDGHITTWSVCDSFCGRVLKQLIKQFRQDAIEAILRWKDAQNLWRARASVVGLLSIVNEKEGRSVIVDGCLVLMKREERFAKTAVGWALREISKHDPQATLQFLKSNFRFLTVESVKNAAKHLDKEERDGILAKLKNSD